MKRKFTLLTFMLATVSTYTMAQQSSPIDMIYTPRDASFSISGVGGGNLYELKSSRSSTSGQIALDWNIALKDGYTKRSETNKYTTLTTVFKYNPLLQSNYVNGDTMEMRKVAFVDNEFNMMLGLRLSSLSDMVFDQDAKVLKSFFMDATMAPYSIDGDSSKTGFKNFNLNFGFQWGIVAKTSFGIVGLSVAPEVNYISIYEDETNGHAFEQLNNSAYKLSHNIFGWGLKISIPLNDFCFFFEFRNYYPMDNKINIRGLTDRAIFSFGGVATGTAFTNKEENSSSY